MQIRSSERAARCFLVFPEVKEKVPVVLVIHENRGLTDWVRSLADQLAEAGYIAIAPDLLSGIGPEGGKQFEPVIYDGAGHGFMRAGEAPNATPDNQKTRDEAWKRWMVRLQKR